MAARSGDFHPTAITRSKISSPIREYMDKVPDEHHGKSILYHGVGRDEISRQALERNGRHKAVGYDPFHPDPKVRQMPSDQFDEVHSHYTLNVVHPDVGRKIIQEIHDRMKDNGRAVVSVRRDLESSPTAKLRRYKKPRTPRVKFSKSDDLDKAAGDWKHQGYKMNYMPAQDDEGPYGLHAVFAHDPAGQQVGHLAAEDNGDGTFTAHMVEVDPTHQRKGLATAMYQMMEQRTGLKARPDLEFQTRAGEALWRQGKRPFGAGTKMPKGRTSVMKADYYERGLPHGWISPSGEFHEMGPDDDHRYFVSGIAGVHEPESDDDESHILEAYGKGWISVGHAGEFNIQGDKSFIGNRLHPAMKTARDLAQNVMNEQPEETHLAVHVTSPSGPSRMAHVPVEHFVRHGTVLPRHFSKSELEKAMDSGYLSQAHKGLTLLIPVTVAGRKDLAPGVPHHITVKMFRKPQDEVTKEMIDAVNKRLDAFKVPKPHPAQLQLEPSTLHSTTTGKDYHVLSIRGMPKEYQEMYDRLRDVGITHPSYAPHITIDKDLHDKIKSGELAPNLEIHDPELRLGSEIIRTWKS